MDGKALIRIRRKWDEGKERDGQIESQQRGQYTMDKTKIGMTLFQFWLQPSSLNCSRFFRNLRCWGWGWAGKPRNHETST